MLLGSSVHNFYIVRIIPNTDLTKNLNSAKTGGVKMKSCEGSQIFPDLTSYPVRFMDAGRRHESFGSETKDNLLLTAIAVARVTSFPFLIFKLIYLFGYTRSKLQHSGSSILTAGHGSPSCSMQDPQSSLQVMGAPAAACRILNLHCRTWEPQLRHAGSFSAVARLLVVAYGIQFPDHSGEHGVSHWTTREDSHFSLDSKSLYSPTMHIHDTCIHHELCCKRRTPSFVKLNISLQAIGRPALLSGGKHSLPPRL